MNYHHTVNISSVILTVYKEAVSTQTPVSAPLVPASLTPGCA